MITLLQTVTLREEITTASGHKVEAREPGVIVYIYRDCKTFEVEFNATSTHPTLCVTLTLAAIQELSR